MSLLRRGDRELCRQPTRRAAGRHVRREAGGETPPAFPPRPPPRRIGHDAGTPPPHRGRRANTRRVQEHPPRPPRPSLALWPARTRPFGDGRERYSGAFVVATLICALGAGISIYEGWLHFRDPEPLRDPTVNYIVLAIAFALEGASWTIAVREFRRSKGDAGWWQAIHESKDPPGFIVLFEDSAALAGLVIAGLGVWLSHSLNDPRIDGVASILIGLVLGLVAILLAREAKGLLIGERADPAVVETIRAIVADRPWISHVNHIRTIHTAPDSIFAAISADFVDNLPLGAAETMIEML